MLFFNKEKSIVFPVILYSSQFPYTLNSVSLHNFVGISHILRHNLARAVLYLTAKEMLKL